MEDHLYLDDVPTDQTAFIRAAQQKQAEAAEAEAEEIPVEGDDEDPEFFQHIHDAMNIEHWHRAGAVIFASDLSIRITANQGIEIALPDVLTIARYIETGK